MTQAGITEQFHLAADDQCRTGVVAGGSGKRYVDEDKTNASPETRAAGTGDDQYLMKIRIITFAFIAAAFSISAFGQKNEDAKAAVAVVDQMFAKMAAADPAGILATGTPESQLVALFKLKDGSTKIEVIGGEQFSKMFADKTKVLSEQMYDPKVEVHGDLAMVWGRYVFFDGDKLSHCGVNTFNLVRTPAGWKIANGASTIDRNDCSAAEKAMKPIKK